MMVEDTETVPKWRGGEGVRMILFSQRQGLLALFWINAERSRRGRPSSPLFFRRISRHVSRLVSCHVPRRRSRSQEHAGSSNESPCLMLRVTAWSRGTCAERGTERGAPTDLAT